MWQSRIRMPSIVQAKYFLYWIKHGGDVEARIVGWTVKLDSIELIYYALKKIGLAHPRGVCMVIPTMAYSITCHAMYIRVGGLHNIDPAIGEHNNRQSPVSGVRGSV